jgi:hypothetical protein
MQSDYASCTTLMGMQYGCNTQASEVALFFYTDWYLELDLASS